MISLHWLQLGEHDVPRDNGWLSPSEALRLSELRFPKRRTEWRLGRWTAKTAVAAYLQLAPDTKTLASIEIRATESGAPEVLFEHRTSAVAISLSHRAGFALCAVAAPEVALGCDLEVSEPRPGSFLCDYFQPEEQALVLQSPSCNRAMLITLLWSAKESALKALGKGLTLDTRSVAVGIPGISCGADSRLDAKGPNLDPEASFESWRPLHVTWSNRCIFYGWWQCKHNLMRTLVSDPAPALPVALDEAPIQTLVPTNFERRMD